MAASPMKQRTLNAMSKNETADWQHDISTHVREKNRQLQSRTEKFNYFSTLAQGFVVHNPLGDPDFVNFMNNIYGIVKDQLFNLQEENRVVKEIKDDNVDTKYKLFLDNCRVDGKSYVLDIAKDRIFVKYEQEDNASHPGPPMHSASNNTNDRTNHISFQSNVKPEAEKHGKRRGRRPKHPAENNTGVQTNVGSEAEKQDANRTDKCRGGNLKSVISKAKPSFKSQNGFGGQTQDGLDVNHTVKEEEEDYDDHPPDIKRPVQEPVLNVEQWWAKNKVKALKQTEFREKLMDALKMPYCEEEYETLFQQISDRKPVQNHRDLRGRIKIYKENRPGKSFLDHHTDLAKKIDSVRDDRPRVLNLLRGFFYWLVNLSHEGAFLPWKDTSCLEVLPH